MQLKNMTLDWVLKQTGKNKFRLYNLHTNRSIKISGSVNIKKDLNIVFKKYNIKDNITDVLDKLRKNGPDIMDIAITGRCNLDCKHCYWGRDNQKFNDIALSKLKKIFSDAKKLGVITIALTGGEPMSHKNFVEILNYLHKLRFRTIIVTNGTLIHKHQVILSKIKPFEVTVSLDGFKNVYEKIRGYNYDKVIKNVLLLKKIGIKLRINCILSKKIKKEIDKFKKFCFNELGAKCVAFIPVALKGSAKKNKDVFMDYLNVKKFVCTEHSLDRIYCHPFYQRISVGFDGKVYPCQFFREIGFYQLGDINEKPLFEIYNLIKGSNMFPKAKNIECETCKHLIKCGGGCFGRAVALSNMLNKCDPVWCEIFKKGFTKGSLLPEPINPLYTTLYNEYLHEYEKPKDLYDKAKEIIQNLNINSLIEIGCGDGSFIKSLDNVKTRVGVDSSLRFIKEAKKGNNGVKFIVSSIKELKLKKRFDLSIALFSFFNHFKSRDDVANVFKKIETISKLFMFDAIDVEKFPKVSKLKFKTKSLTISQFVYRDKKSVYDFRKYVKNNNVYYHSFSFPVIKWKTFFNELGLKLVKDVKVSKTRRIYLVKF